MKTIKSAFGGAMLAAMVNRGMSVSAIVGALMLAAWPSFAQQPNPDRNAYFGEEHIHTSWSVDAWLMGNRLTGPDEASSTLRARP